jgi:hypothetical protein
VKVTFCTVLKLQPSRMIPRSAFSNTTLVICEPRTRTTVSHAGALWARAGPPEGLSLRMHGDAARTLRGAAAQSRPAVPWGPGRPLHYIPRQPIGSPQGHHELGPTHTTEPALPAPPPPHPGVGGVKHVEAVVARLLALPRIRCICREPAAGRRDNRKQVATSNSNSQPKIALHGVCTMPLCGTQG